MIELFFGNVPAVISTIVVIGIWSYIIITIQKRKQITNWRSRIAFITLCGLILCIFVATRDRYDLSVVAMTETEISGGIFAADSIQSYLCCIGGGVIAYSFVSAMLSRNQKYREIMFYLLSLTVILKTIIIEASRVIMILS